MAPEGNDQPPDIKVSDNRQEGGQDNVQQNVGQVVRGVVIGILKISPFVLLPPVVFVALVAGFREHIQWQQSLPEIMTGDFNVAVAEFLENSAMEDRTISRTISRNLFNFLESEYQSSNFDLVVRVAHDKIGPVSSAEDAKKLAQDIHADVVIYGTVSVINNEASIAPLFYVTDAYNTDVGEFTGQYQLAEPLEVPVTELLGFDDAANARLRQKTTILVEFTKGLVYVSSEKFASAQHSVERAIEEVASYGSFNGAEVLYVVGSNVALRQKNADMAKTYADAALTLNPNYARAYIAQANAYYLELDFERALDYYQQAMQLPNPPYGAYIFEKCNVGIGNIYAYLYQVATLPEDKLTYAQLAQFHFGEVIAAYDQNHDTGLAELTALAHYGQGVIHQQEGNPEAAAESFKQALAMGKGSDLRERAQRRLAEVS